MTQILLFHCVLGLRPLEEGLAREWRDAGHEVVLPDLYGGRTAETYDAGFAILEDIGFDTLQDRAMAAADTVPADAVLAGLSLGGAMAAHVWRARPGAKGVLFLAGPGDWPGPQAASVPVELHAARPDPFDDETVFADWHAANPGADLTCYRYDGAGHLFLDPALDDFDAAANALCRDRCRAFLARL